MTTKDHEISDVTVDDFRKLLRDLDLNQKIFANKVGLKHRTVTLGLSRGVLSREGNTCPIWAVAFVEGFKAGNKYPVEYKKHINEK